MDQPTRPRYNAEIFVSEVENGAHIDFTVRFRGTPGTSVPEDYQREVVYDSVLDMNSIGNVIEELLDNACDYATGYQFNNESE